MPATTRSPEDWRIKANYYQIKGRCCICGSTHLIGAEPRFAYEVCEEHSKWSPVQVTAAAHHEKTHREFNMKADAIIEDLIRSNEFRPEWAVRSTNGELVLGASLPTRDGRRCGNAHIINSKFPIGTDFKQEYVVLTDAGTEMILNEAEVIELFHPPQWVSNVEEVKRKFGPR